MKQQETCDVCGTPITGEAVRAELSVEDMTCPTAMTFHPACYEQASSLWTANPDSACVVDPEFPETQSWTPRPVPS